MAVVAIDDIPTIPSRFISIVFNPDETHPSGADAVQVRCAVYEADSTATADLIESYSACAPNREIYGQSELTQTINLRWTNDLHTKLAPFANSEVTFVQLQDYTQPISPTNIEEFGRVQFPPLPGRTYFVKNDIRNLDLELPVPAGEFGEVSDPAGAYFTHPAGPSLNPIP